MTNPTPTQADVEAVAQAIYRARFNGATMTVGTLEEQARSALTAAIALGYRRDRPGLSAGAIETIREALKFAFGAAHADLRGSRIGAALDELAALEGEGEAGETESKETTP